MKPNHRFAIVFLLLTLMALFVGSVTAYPDDETRQTRVRRAIRGLGLTALGEESLLACDSDANGNLLTTSLTGTNAIAAVIEPDSNYYWVMDLTSTGQRVPLTFSFPQNTMSRATGRQFPAVCMLFGSTNTPQTASNGGSNVPLNISGDFAVTAQLPLSAYMRPGVYSIDMGNGWLVDITVPPAPAQPSGLTYQRGDGNNCDYMLAGFQPGEEIVGLFLSDADNEGDPVTDLEFSYVRDAIEITADSRGYALSTNSLCLVDGVLLLFIGNLGSGLMYPPGNSLFVNSFEAVAPDPELLAALPADSTLLGGNALIDYLRPFIFEGVTTGSSSTTSIDCPGALASRLAVGGTAQRGSNNVRIRSNPGTDQLQTGWIDSSAPVSITGGPECVGGMIWWEVDFNGRIGWAAEATSSGYLLAPQGSGRIGTGSTGGGSSSSGGNPGPPGVPDNPPGSLYVENAYFDASSDDVYEIYGYQGQNIYISFSSDGGFEPYLDFQDQNGSTLATASDYPEAELSYTLPYTGTYYIVAWAAGDTGNGFYTVNAVWQ